MSGSQTIATKSVTEAVAAVAGAGIDLGGGETLPRTGAGFEYLGLISLPGLWYGLKRIMLGIKNRIVSSITSVAILVVSFAEIPNIPLPSVRQMAR